MKEKTFRYIFFVIVIFLIGLAIYLLYKDGKNEIDNIQNNELEINMVRELNIGISGYDTINPILSNNRDIQYIDKLIFEPLVDITNDFKIENRLAKEFSKINNTTYIIKLREDVFWHDDERFKAEDVIFTVNNLKNNNINSIYKGNVKDIQSINKIDDYTIKIILDKEVEFFEYMMCIPIIASHAYDSNTLQAKNNIPIGTGKFKIAKIENSGIIIEKSHYENESKIKSINLIFKDTPKDLYSALTKNEIDFMITDNIGYEEYIGSLGYNIKPIVGREFDYLVLNNESLILSQKEIRKAISYAIDVNEINYNIYNNKYNVCKYPLDYGSYLYNQENKKEYDINKAKSMLVENGWVFRNNIWQKGSKKLNLKLLVKEDNEKRIAVAENIKEQLSKIGININIIKSSNKQFNSYIKYKNYDMILTGNIISNSPNLETYFSDDNLSNFHNQEANIILNNIKSINNQEEALKEEYSKLNKIYKEETPFISLYFDTIFILASKNLKGNLEGNWYNIYYNIDNWYKVE